MQKRLLSGLLAGLLLAAALVLSTPQTGSAQLSTFDTQLVTRVNEHRAGLGLAPLTEWAPLSAASLVWSNAMASGSGACLSQGTNFVHDPALSAGAASNPPGTVNIGENIAYSCGFPPSTFDVTWSTAAGPLPAYCVSPMDYTTADFIACTWLSSPSHRNNIEGANWTHMGSGTLLRPIDGGIQVWSTHRFTESTPTATGPGYHSVNPARIYDSRTLNSPWGTQEDRAVQVTGLGGVPAGAIAVAVQVTSVSPTADTFVTAYPTGAARPVTASKNFGPGTFYTSITNDLLIVGIGTGGKISVYNNAGATHLVFDVVGYYSQTSGDSYTGVSPARIYDSRTIGAPWSPGHDRAIQITGLAGVPTNATAVAVHITSVFPTADTFVTAYPAGSARPVAASKNFGPGADHEAITNDLLIVPIGIGGTISLYNNAGFTHLVLDVVGYYSPSATGGKPVSVTPARIYDSSGIGAPWSPGHDRAIQVTGLAGVPATANAVVLHVTSVFPTADSFVTAYATGTTRPVAASKNFGPGADHTAIANDLLIVPLGAGGTISLYNNAGFTHLVVDVVGYS